VAEPRQLDAALVQSERLFKREISLFQFFHDLFELGDRSFEILD